jgi:hypothetical protein
MFWDRYTLLKAISKQGFFFFNTLSPAKNKSPIF